MSCKHTYNGKRYDSLEEARAALITPQQKQQALQLYSQYLEQNPNGDIEGFKKFTVPSAQTSNDIEITKPEEKTDNWEETDNNCPTPF
jgi:hypothetical protein